MPESGRNAVTWGVFPGQEIAQSTIIEKESFLAWKVRYLLRPLGPASNLRCAGRSVFVLGGVGDVLPARLQRTQAVGQHSAEAMARQHRPP